MVYQTTEDTVEDQIARVGLQVAGKLIQQTSDVIERVYQIMFRKYNVCNELSGCHIRPLL